MKIHPALIGLILLACSQPKGDSSQETSSVTTETQIDEQVVSADAAAVPEMKSKSEFKFTIDTLSAKGFYPQLVLKGTAVLFSTENYEGLWFMDISTEKVVQLTDKRGAGYKPNVLGSTVVYQTKGKVKRLEGIDLGTQQAVEIASDLSRLSPEQYQRHMSDKKTNVVLSDDLTGIEVTTEGNQVIQPLGEGNYLFAHLSPDGTKILTKCAGKKAVVCDLKGNVLHELADVITTAWVDDRTVLYAKTMDDGMQQLSAGIGLMDVMSQEMMPLAADLDVQLESPSYDPASGRIVAHTAEGLIFLFDPK